MRVDDMRLMMGTKIFEKWPDEIRLHYRVWSSPMVIRNVIDLVIWRMFFGSSGF